MRQVTLDIAGSKSTLMTYTKFGPFTALGMIQYRKREWMGVRVNAEGGRFPKKKIVLHKAILPFFAEKAEMTANAQRQMSTKQQAQACQEFERRSLWRRGDDHTVEATLADADTFGSEAEMRKSVGKGREVEGA